MLNVKSRFVRLAAVLDFVHALCGVDVGRPGPSVTQRSAVRNLSGRSNCLTYRRVTKLNAPHHTGRAIERFEADFDELSRPCFAELTSL